MKRFDVEEIFNRLASLVSIQKFIALLGWEGVYIMLFFLFISPNIANNQLHRNLCSKARIHVKITYIHVLGLQEF